MTYLLCIGEAESLTEASWNTTLLQMDRILDQETALPFTLEEAQYYRREMIPQQLPGVPGKEGSAGGVFRTFFSTQQLWGTKSSGIWLLRGTDAPEPGHAGGGKGQWLRRIQGKGA